MSGSRRERFLGSLVQILGALAAVVGLAWPFASGTLAADPHASHRLLMIVTRFSPQHHPGRTGFMMNPHWARYWQKRVAGLPIARETASCPAAPYYMVWWYRPRARRIVFRARALPVCRLVVFDGRFHWAGGDQIVAFWRALGRVTGGGI